MDLRRAIARLWKNEDDIHRTDAPFSVRVDGCFLKTVFFKTLTVIITNNAWLLACLGFVSWAGTVLAAGSPAGSVVAAGSPAGSVVAAGSPAGIRKPGPAIIRARLDRVEVLVKSGENAAALSTLQKLCRLYPSVPVFYERAIGLAMNLRDYELVELIAAELKKRFPGNRVAFDAAAGARLALEAACERIADIESFRALAIRHEVTRRGLLVLRAVEEYRLKRGRLFKLNKENSEKIIDFLYRQSYLDEPVKCPLDDGVYVSTRSGEGIMCCSRTLKKLPLTRKRPAIEPAVLVKALKDESVIVRNYARELLLRNEFAEPVMGAADFQAARPGDDNDVLRFMADMARAMKILGRRGVRLKPGALPVFIGLCKELTGNGRLRIRVNAWYCLFMLGARPRLKLDDFKAMFNEREIGDPVFDSRFFAAILMEKPSWTDFLVQCIRNGDHFQPDEVLFRALTGARSISVVSFLVDCLSRDRFIESYLDILDVLKLLTGKRFELTSQWRSWLRKAGNKVLNPMPYAYGFAVRRISRWRKVRDEGIRSWVVDKDAYGRGLKTPRLSRFYGLRMPVTKHDSCADPAQ